MNCEQFIEIIDEFADYKLMEANVRNAAASHVALCPSCATRFAGAQTVGRSLVVAAAAENEEAPARVKTNLLAAFAEQRKAAIVVDISNRRRTIWWATAAIAAAAAVLVAIVLPIWRMNSSTEPPQIASAPNQTPTAANGPGLFSPPPIVSPAPTPSTPARAVKTRTAAPRHRLSQKVNAMNSVSIAENRTPEFVPLTYLATATAVDSGTVVRVRLSKAALVRLGLPVSAENSNESVQADVVLGDDGLARAIRLVE